MNSSDLLLLLPKMKFLKGETIVFCIDEKVINNDVLLDDIIRQIVLLKSIDANIIIVAGNDLKVNEYYNENYGIYDKLDNNDVFELRDQYDVVDVLVKHNGIYRVIEQLRKFNINSLYVSGCDTGIFFDEAILKKDRSQFSIERKHIYNNRFSNNKNKNSIDCVLNELLETNILPVISPFCLDQFGNKYVMNTKSFASYIAGKIFSLKYVILYTNEDNIPQGFIYGTEKANKIVNSGTLNVNSLKIIESGVKAVESGVQGVHIIDVKKICMLEEIVMNNFSGLFIYDDTINQI